MKKYPVSCEKELEWLLAFVRENKNDWDDTLNEQLCGLWTALILHTEDVEVDTARYDVMLSRIWAEFSSGGDTKDVFDKDDFENFMCQHLV